MSKQIRYNSPQFFGGGQPVHFNIGGAALRIAAAILVLFCHIGQYCKVTAFDIGASGVQLFFVLSGYWAFVSYDKKRNAKEYYISRIKRIVPIYWGALIINYFGTLLMHSVVNGFSFQEIFVNGPCGVRYLRYFFFLQGLIPSDNYSYWNNAYGLWTMSAFCVFYLLVPLLHKMFSNYRRTLCGIAIALFITPLCREWFEMFLLNVYNQSDRLTWFVSQFPLNQLYCFLFGVLVYFARKEERQGITFCLLGFAYVFWHQIYAFEILYTMTVLGVFSCKEMQVNGIAGNAVRILDKLSFSLYLIHPIILQYVNATIGSAIPPIVLFVVMVIVCITGAYVLSWLVNERIPQWRKKCVR